MVLSVGLAGCTAAEFRCEGSEQCSDGGTCEVTGFCSQVDDTCPSGRRYVPLSGSLSGECVVESEGSTGPSTTPASTSTSTTSTSVTSLTTEPAPTTSSTGLDPTEAPESSTGANETLEFIDDSAEDFEAGTLNGAIYDDGLRLPPEESSIWFFSRVFDAGVDTASWTQLSWQPRAPYVKPLPDGGVSEEGYAEGNANMDGNVLLLHLNTQSDLITPGTALPDTSPAMHDVVVQGTANATRPMNPKIGEAIGLNFDAYVRIAPDAADSLQFGTSDFTWSMWFRTDTPCFDKGGSVGINRVFMGIEDAAGGPTSHAWFGCFNPAHPSCGGETADGFLGGTAADANGGGLGVFCPSQPIVGSGWRHAALVKRGHDDATLEVWFDGVLVQSTSETYGKGFSFPPNTPFTLGRLGNGFFADVDLDEVAIFRRALSPEEIGDVYRRGSLLLGVLTRVCETPDCEDVPWTGPGGSATEGWTDVSPEPGETLELSNSTGRYFQYSVRMIGIPGGTGTRTPVLDAVRVTATL